MKTVIVTPRSLSSEGHPALRRIDAAGYAVTFPAPGRRPTEEELIAALDGCVGYLAGVETISRRLIAAAGGLKVISRNGVGVDNIDLEAAAEHGITVARAVGANARGVAELAVGHMLAAARGIPAGDAALKSGTWQRERGIELRGRTLGLIGCGCVGQIVAHLAGALDMRVCAYDPFPRQDFRPGGRFSFNSFDEVIAVSDVISLHCPPRSDRHVIGAGEIARMKTGVILVNTAREGLVDTPALIDALNAGTIHSYCIDAFESEPPRERTLVSHPRVIATAHIGGFTRESVDLAAETAVDNLLGALAEG